LEPILNVDNVTKRFADRRVLNEVSFTLPRGAVGGLIGPNGAGKTTLFSIIAGFLRPDAGSVMVSGHHIQRDTTGERGLLSILPQDARFQEGVSIERQFYWYARTAGFDHEGARQELRRVFSLVDLLDAAAYTAASLSHGMHKRMAIAQALIGSPQLILLDEPTAGLDPANANTIRTLIRNLRTHRTVLVSSHNLDEIADLCDHVVIINQGVIVESKSMRNLVNQDQRVSFSLSAPLADDLFAALRDLPGVVRVAAGPQGLNLTCDFALSIEEDPEPLCALLRTLCLARAPFTAMTKGARLEDAFLQITGSQAR
jgi:ABC-2 type transport system ATP-binding protein